MLSCLPPRAGRVPAAAIRAFVLLLAFTATSEAQKKAQKPAAQKPAAQKPAAQTPAQTPTQELQGFPQAWTGPELSADFVGRNPDGTTARTRLYFGKDKIRWDAVPDASGKSESSSFGSTVIVDYAKGTAYMVDPAKKQYMEGTELSQLMMGMMGVMRLVFQPADMNNPCLMWLMLGAQQQPEEKVSCKSEGSEVVNGRAAQKYALSDASAGRAQLWIDKKTRLVVRMRGDKDEGNVDVENLREGPQPASLFEVPAGYNKVDVSMGSLLRGALTGRSGAGQGTSAGDSAGTGVKDAIKEAGKEAAKETAKEAAKEKATKKLRGILRIP